MSDMRRLLDQLLVLSRVAPIMLARSLWVRAVFRRTPLVSADP